MDGFELLMERDGPKDFFQQAGVGCGLVDCLFEVLEGSAIVLADLVILTSLRLARLSHDCDEVGLKVAGQFDAAGDDRPFHCILTELMLGTVFNHLEVVVFE
jgi:hypothetical protein